MTATFIVAYLVLFAAVGFLFVFVALLLGRLLRPSAPNAQKQEIYECGEPTIGPGFVQFDLRFYVVALVFIIFEVEVAFFFPWATVFGKANQLADLNRRIEAVDRQMATLPDASTELKEAKLLKAKLVEGATLRYTELAGAESGGPDSHLARNAACDRSGATTLALAAMADVGVFFAVLMVGFAYVWKRGDLSWVRAVARQPAPEAEPVENHPGTAKTL